jgi:hypothetical protein
MLYRRPVYCSENMVSIWWPFRCTATVIDEIPTASAAERLSEILQISPAKTDMRDCMHIRANQPHQIIKAVNAHLRDQPNAADGTQDRDCNC